MRVDFQCVGWRQATRRLRTGGRKEGGLCVANKQTPMWREMRSEESDLGTKPFSLAREVVPKQKPDTAKLKSTFHRRVRHAFVARRMVARFNCAI